MTLKYHSWDDATGPSGREWEHYKRHAHSLACKGMIKAGEDEVNFAQYQCVCGAQLLELLDGPTQADDADPIDRS